MWVIGVRGVSYAQIYIWWRVSFIILVLTYSHWLYIMVSMVLDNTTMNIETLTKAQAKE